MGKSVVLVADRDTWVPRAIAAGLPDGFDVVPCTTARGTLNACCALEPDCLVTELALADDGGIWLTKTLRAQTSHVASTPIIMLAPTRDEELQVTLLHSGADVVIPKPFNILELVAQIRALIAMMARLRSTAEVPKAAGLPFPEKGERRRAIVGDLTRMPAASVLGALELDQSTGDLNLRGRLRASKALVLRLEHGAIVSGRLGSRRLTPVEAVMHAIEWDGPRFDFVPDSDRPGPPDAEALAPLLVRALSRPPDAPRFAPAPRRSGTHTKVALPPPPLAAPGHRLVESMAPSPRPDPRAEPVDEEDTSKIAWRR